MVFYVKFDVVLPCTGELGAKVVCEKIKAGIVQKLLRITAKHDDYIYPVYVTFPKDGEDFQKLMESAFKRVSDKEMLEKIVSITPVPGDTLAAATTSSANGFEAQETHRPEQS